MHNKSNQHETQCYPGTMQLSSFIHPQKSTRSVGTQWPEYEFNIVGDTTKIEKDHTYCGQSLELHSPSPRHSTQLDFHPPTHSTPVKVPQAVVSSSEESSSMGEPSMISCVNSENVTRGSTSSSDSLADESAILYDEDKYIVFISCLRQLFGHLTCFAGNCRKQLMIIKESVGGSQLIVDFVCPENHCFTWRSQPNVGRMPAGNFLAATGILLSGNTFKRVENFARSINLKLHSKKTHDAVQRSYLYPSIAHEFENELSRVSVVLKEKKLSLAGDGRCDSPGHCAKYGTYTLMDLDTNLIVSSHVTHVCEAGNSNAMEKLGLVKGLTSLRERCLDIETLTTDGHIQIASYLKKERPDIDHQLDLWHISKSVVKKLSNAAKKNVNSELKEWIKSIAYHLWFSVAACEKNADRLIEIWTSIVHHIANEHSWVTGDVVHKCLHESLSADVERKKRWLMPGSAPHKALSDIVFDKRLLTNLRKCNKFCHTGMLESFHALLLKFCPKRQHFWYDGMVARTSLAVLDHNQNVGREQATIKAGPMRGTKRFNIVHSKRGNQWVAKPIMEEKRTDYVRSIAIRALESKLNENTTRATLPQSQTETFKIPQNIAGNEKPNKADAIASFCSRFDKKC